MVELLTILTPIGLIDSTSMIPVCIVILVVLLAGPNPVFGSFGLILGIFVAYLACGLIIMLGLQSAFDQIDAFLERIWKRPKTEELIFQIVLGIVLCVFGLRITRGRKKRAEEPVASSLTAPQAFLAGAGLTIVGLPGAIPYFAAVDLILRADVTSLQRFAALGYYNVIFVAPLAAIAALSLVLGDRSQGVLDAMKRFFDRWGQRAIVALLIALGAILIIDGVGWFVGYPIIPV